MKYAQYCPECSKNGIKSKLEHEDSKIICAQCGYMSKTTILDEILFTFDILEKSNIPMLQICSQVKKNREQNSRDVGDFNCLKSYIRWSILDNSRGRGVNLFRIKIDGKEELVEKITN